MTPVPGPAEGLNAAVAAQIRAEAAAAHLTDKALAEKASVNYASLRRWLGKDKGNERHIDVAVLGELAAALGIDPAEIVQRARQRLRVDVVYSDVAVEHTASAEGGTVSPLPTRPGDDLSSFEDADAARDEDRGKPKLGDA